MCDKTHRKNCVNKHLRTCGQSPTKRWDDWWGSRRQEAHSSLSSLQREELTSHSIQARYTISTFTRKQAREKERERKTLTVEAGAAMQTAGSHTHALASSQKCGIFWTFSQEEKKKKNLSLSREFKILPAAAALIAGIRVCRPRRRCWAALFYRQLGANKDGLSGISRYEAHSSLQFTRRGSRYITGY